MKNEKLDKNDAKFVKLERNKLKNFLSFKLNK